MDAHAGGDRMVRGDHPVRALDPARRGDGRAHGDGVRDRLGDDLVEPSAAVAVREVVLRLPVLERVDGAPEIGLAVSRQLAVEVGGSEARRLLERLEGNLSELVGPLVARVILGRGMATPPTEAAVAA